MLAVHKLSPGVYALDSDELMFMRPHDADEHVCVCDDLHSFKSKHIIATVFHNLQN